MTGRPDCTMSYTIVVIKDGENREMLGAGTVNLTTPEMSVLILEGVMYHAILAINDLWGRESRVGSTNHLHL